MSAQAGMPEFGERFVNTQTTELNPRHVGTYIRTVKRTGRTNRGTWWELTDEHGDVWLGNPATLAPTAQERKEQR